MTRAVVDASVLVSALIAPRDTPPSQVLGAWARERLELVVSPQLIAQVTGVLARPKFDRYVTPEEVADFLDMLRSDAVVHPDPAVIERAPATRTTTTSSPWRRPPARCWSPATATCSKAETSQTDPSSEITANSVTRVAGHR